MTNNSQIAQDFAISLEQEPLVDVIPSLKEREAKLVKIVEAIRELMSSKAWSTLKTEIFDAVVSSLERELKNEAKKDAPDTLKLTKLSGQLKWAEKYASLEKLEEQYMVELKGLKQKIYG